MTTDKHLYPKAGPRSTVSQAEVAVYKALARDLPAGWRAWHSLKLRTRGQWEGEGDFVIAVPERGLLVLEVKGGQIELRDGLWYQNGRALKKAPRDQAQGFVRHLASAIKERGAAVPAYGVACAFPDCDFTDGPTCGDLNGLVIGERQLRYLKEALPALAERAIPDYGVPQDRRWMDLLHAQWGETWVPHVRLLDRVADAAERAIALADEQVRILDIAADNPRAIITGGAGTGKTVVARELCIRKARAGKRVQYFCFTDALAMSVDRQFEAVREEGHQVQATPIRRYAAELLQASGGKTGDSSDFWANVSFEAACSSLPPVDARPDLVVIDEAQDLDDSDKALITELADGRDLWIFRDPKQKFWAERGIGQDFDSGFTRLNLQNQHRNPSAIARLVAAYAGDEAVASDLAPDPSIRIVPCQSEELLRKLTHELTLLRKEGAGPGDIAIVTLAGQTISEVLKHDRLGSHRLVRATDGEAPSQIVADTFLRFKGLERPFVIVCELGAASSRSYARRMHIAASRAAVELVVVASEENLAADRRLEYVVDRGLLHRIPSVLPLKSK